jgi:hypothetical protein
MSITDHELVHNTSAMTKPGKTLKSDKGERNSLAAIHRIKGVMEQIKERGHQEAPPAIATDGKDAYREAMVETGVKCLSQSQAGRVCRWRKNNRNQAGITCKSSSAANEGASLKSRSRSSTATKRRWTWSERRLSMLSAPT